MSLFSTNVAISETNSHSL